MQKIGSVLIVVALVLTVLVHPRIYAASMCQASVSLDKVSPLSSTDFVISITNTGDTDIVWIDLTVPSSNFTYTGNSISGWGASGHNGGIILSGSSLGPGQTADFPINVSTDVSTAAAVNWQVQTSDDYNAVSTTTCSGNLSTAISGHPPNDQVNGVSNIRVLSIKPSSATVTWQSDSPMSSLVYYGKTSDYGDISTYNQTIGTDHSVTLTGLSPQTGYHFQVAGSDGQGGFAYSADNTFFTSSLATINNTTSSPYSSVNSKGQSADRVPPQVSLDTKLSGVYKTAPTITGAASDNIAIARVDYSTDGGKNWLPVDVLKKAGLPTVSYAFTPLLSQDGNYSILVRAVDTNGNMSTTAPKTVVIDRLPPLVGGNVVSVGPQIMQPGSDGTIKALAGVDQKITLSAVGGPTSITLEAATTVKTKKGAKAYVQSFSLTASEETGLWSGVLGFTRAGVYTLTANAVDGAGNKTSRVLNDVYVSSPGQSLDKSNNKPISSTVTVYYLEPESHTWVVWDGAAFSQKNPQTTNSAKTFSLFLPPGTYYLQAKAPGYHTLVGSIFTLAQPTPLNTNLRLSPLRGLHFRTHYLSLPSLAVQHTDMTSQSSKKVVRSSLLGKQAPDFSLVDTTGATIRTANLLGRPTVISFDSTWAPVAAEQLAALSKLQTNPDINVIPVAIGENSGRVQAYTAIADVKLRWLVDPDSTLSNSYNVQSLPLHCFIDRKGVVRQVVVGVLSEQQLLDKLVGL